MFLYSPLEQFQILYLLPSQLKFFDFSITFSLVIYVYMLLFLVAIYYFFFYDFLLIKIISNTFNYNFESLVNFMFTLVKSIFPTGRGLQLFPYLFLPFFFVTFSNILGLIPYSYTLTSQLFITGTLAFSLAFSTIWLGITTHKIHYFDGFLPSNTSVGLSFLIIPIEIISSMFRPISLSVRLFANMMAGHSLLKVIVSFSWKLLLVGSLLHSFSLGLLLVLFFLETAVALIQAYVFTMLSLIYINDLFIHH